MTKYVYDFDEGNRTMKDLLGGKGANLAEMTNMGLPVPPGFTITTEACQAYLASGSEPAALAAEIDEHLATLEARRGRKLGQADNPLLVSVRSGAKFSMPGMMETVLNIGLNDVSVEGFAAVSGSPRSAWDSYRRLLSMFGKTVLGIEGHLFEGALHAAKEAKGTTNDLDLTADDFRALVEVYKQIIRDERGIEFPQDPREQLGYAVRAVFDSWNTERAVLYRRQERIPADLGTAVNVQSMAFGNFGDDSGTGVSFTRDPASGHSGVYGDYLVNAQGEDVVAGIRNTMTLAEMGEVHNAPYLRLMDIMKQLEGHYQDLCDIEFTVERGELFMLQTRVGKRTAAAAFRIATQLVDEGVIDMDEAVRRVSGEQLVQLMFPQFDKSGSRELLAKAIPASPGAAVGRVVFTSAVAVEMAAKGESVILVRQETNPEDLPGMIAAQGILTSRGGKTSHAAVVARGMGKTCVCGAEAMAVDGEAGKFVVNGVTVNEGDVISIDGKTGEVFAGAVPVMPSAVVEYFEGNIDPEAADTDDLVKSVHRIMTHADTARRLGVRANADTPEDAARARRFGAGGIGLCRTEHMFLGDRRELVEKLILAEGADEQEAALAALLPMQRGDFLGILAAMDGQPATIRLIDPPLHEFLPNHTEVAIKLEALKASGAEIDPAFAKLAAAVERMHESNPMLGTRGVRLLIKIPGLVALQVRAVAEAAAELIKQGKNPQPEIMIPLVATVQELEIAREQAVKVLADVSAETGVELNFPIGTMIELPRAAVTADQIAASAEFFSFGTNDLTQTTWGFSRDDVEGGFFSDYMDQGVFGVSPFESIDVDGVGSLVRTGTEKGRSTRPALKVGVCGEHGGDPKSIEFFHGVGLNYVSCSPFRVPVARLEAARANLSSSASDTR